jgi:prepilin-type N-terminal cleavage/methylation domain-containing protein
MKRYLPKTASNQKGFTLIELMVVIAIIAILAVVGISLYTNAQRSARDTRRQAEMDAISKSIETARDVTIFPAVYRYDQTIFNNDFPTQKPSDPLGTTVYCMGTSLTAGGVTKPTAAAITAWTGATCPAFGGSTTNITINAGTLSAGFPVGTKSYVVCAKLENGDNAFCKESLLR